MKRICILSFLVQVVLVCIIFALRPLYLDGVIDESTAETFFTYSATAFLLLSPLSIGSAFVSIAAIVMVNDRSFKKILMEQIELGYPHTWLIWRDVKEKYRTQEVSEDD